MIFGVVRLATKVATVVWAVKKARVVYKAGSSVYKTYKKTKKVGGAIKSLGKKKT